jgi:hypothetical protein
MHIFKESFGRHPSSSVPHKTTTVKLDDHFHKCGSVSDKKCSRRPCVLSENVQDMKQQSLQPPCKSLKLPSQVKVKLSLCLTKHHVMKTYWGSRDIVLSILNLGTRWR